jgi:deoxyribose-phosphate aldolase
VLTLDADWLGSRVRLDREVVSRESIADALEHRLFGPDVDLGQLNRGCDYAAEAGLAAVLCRPEHVTRAARRLLGSGTATVAPLAFDAPNRQQDPVTLAAEAREMVSAGASEVSLMVAPGLDRAGCLHLIGEQVDAVVEAVTPQGGSVRVGLDTTHASKDAVQECTAMVGARGPALVQGGSFRGDRVTVSQIEGMRDALPAKVLLKWAQPLRSVEMMLICMAMGVSRFNGDIPTLLKAAKRSSQVAPLMLPIRGVDF